VFDHYILDKNRMAVPVDAMTWGHWFEKASRSRERMVAQEEIGETYYVSTVFLGLDHSFGSNADPMLFEAMIFISADWSEHHMSEIWMARCGTWDDAIDMHERAVAHAQKLLRQLPVIVEERS